MANVAVLILMHVSMLVHVLLYFRASSLTRVSKSTENEKCNMNLKSISWLFVLSNRLRTHRHAAPARLRGQEKQPSGTRKTR
jgi:hypothetical protein